MSIEHSDRHTFPIHHIASDKHELFKYQFRELFDEAGLSLNSPFNRMRVEGHVGPHGKFYNSLVLERLKEAVAEKSGAEYRSALINELMSIRRDIRKNGWDSLLKAPASMIDVKGLFER